MVRLRALLAIAFGCLSPPALGDQFVMDGKRIGAPPLPRDGKPIPQLDGALRAVINQYKVYSVGRPIRVCFFDGDKKLRALFAAAAAEWDEYAPGITFDFGKDGTRSCSEDPKNPTAAHIRVAFRSDGKFSGNWARVGTDAIEAFDKPSINIGDVVNGRLHLTLLKMSQEELYGILLHEIGHALSLEHEHASPEANCEEELLWEKVVYPALAAPPNEWDKPQVDAQLRRLTRGPRLRATKYDRSSIMHYEIPAHWLEGKENSPCYVAGNTKLSTTDKAAIAEVYPSSIEEQKTYLRRLGGVAVHLARTLKIDKDAAKFAEGEIRKALPRQLRKHQLVPKISQCVVGDVSGNSGNVNIRFGNCTVSFN